MATRALLLFAGLPLAFPNQKLLSRQQLNLDLENRLTESEVIYGVMRGRFGSPPWLDLGEAGVGNRSQLARGGRKLGAAKGARLWPGAVVPYQFAETIDYNEWQTMQYVFNNISSVTNIQFVPRKAKDTDYLLITEDMKTYGCGCCSIGLGYLEGSGAHVLVLGPVSEGGCGVNHIGGTHELLHILGLAHTQNRPDRCNYIDVRTDLLTGWGEWRVGQITGAADWFELRIPYDCSSYVHYYQLQGAFWKKSVEKQVDEFMKQQGCESTERGKFVNKCLVDGGHTEGNRVVKEGYERCVSSWEKKHKKCVDTVIRRFPTFKPVDPNGKCKANGINKEKRRSWEISQYDIWALNAAYNGPLPPCQSPKKVGDGRCDRGNNNIGCGYDGGDCCLPAANDRDCIDPCGVRLKFFGGGNRPCRKAPVTKEFCTDHYWYGPNKCSPEYCRQAEEKFLQWQCKKTCSLCNKDPDQKQMDAICNSYLGPEVRAKYKSVKPEKKTNPKKPRNKKKKKAGPNPGKVSKTTFLAEVPRSQTEAGTELCGINNALICRKSTAAGITTPLTTPSPRQIFTQRPETRVTPKARPPQTANPRLKTTTKPKSRKPRPGKAKSKSAKQNQISSRPKGKKGKSRPSKGFVIASAEKRKQLRSYWMRRG